jgi:hypothetical protein
MIRDMVEQIADAILYEGYILYPYRPSSIKNRHRWNFGGLCPRSYSEAQRSTERWRSQTECLIVGSAETPVQIKLRFLHLVNRQVMRLSQPVMEPAKPDESSFIPVDSLSAGGRLFQSWQEANEREIDLPEFVLGAEAKVTGPFHFQLPESQSVEPLREADGQQVGALVRRQNTLEVEAHIHLEPLKEGLYKLTVEILNLTPFDNAKNANREEAMLFSLASSHLILKIRDGTFVSLLDPATEHADEVERCENVGTYPVLVGDEGNRTVMLSSPVILYDYPKIAPESAGDLFDGTEIDEILTLRILALTDAEKSEMRQGDERARRMLERIEANPEHLANLHGAIRSIEKADAPDELGRQSTLQRHQGACKNEWDGAIKAWNPFEREQKPQLKSVMVRGVELQRGDRVRLRPQKKADIMDLALADQVALIESIEQDYEEQIHLAVVLEDDPGRDLGELRQPGHRFFFTPDEVEPVDLPTVKSKPRQQAKKA